MLWCAVQHARVDVRHLAPRDLTLIPAYTLSVSAVVDYLLHSQPTLPVATLRSLRILVLLLLRLLLLLPGPHHVHSHLEQLLWEVFLLDVVQHLGRAQHEDEESASEDT
jgi:hypothetical protein